MGAKRIGFLLSESRDQPLHCHCSPGTLWRNVRAGTSPSPRPGKMSRRWGRTQHRQKVLQSLPLSGAQVPLLSVAPHQPHRVTFWRVSPLPAGPRCLARDGPLIGAHVSLPAPRQGTPLPPLTTNTRDAFPHPLSIVFKEISGSHQVHQNAHPPSPSRAPVSLSLRGREVSAGLKGASQGVTRENLASQTHRVRLARMPVTCRLQ